MHIDDIYARDILEQFIPSPAYPVSHAQLKLPFVLVQLALTSQGEYSIHSSISAGIMIRLSPQR